MHELCRTGRELCVDIRVVTLCHSRGLKAKFRVALGEGGMRTLTISQVFTRLEILFKKFLRLTNAHTSIIFSLFYMNVVIVI